MITRLDYKVPDTVFQQLRDQIPNFHHRLDINTQTGNFFYDGWVISDEFKNTVWEEALACLPFAVGEARLMKLEPGTAYYSHADIDDRYHLNITGSKSFLVDLDENKLHTVDNDGYWYEMNAGIRHSAVNFGNQTRIQLVVRKLLQKNNLTEPVPVNISVENGRHDFRYVFDDVFSPLISRFVKDGLISDFSTINNEVTFKVEKSHLTILEEASPEGFKVNICQ